MRRSMCPQQIGEIVVRVEVCCTKRTKASCRRICPDRLKQGDLSLVQVAACAGFSAPSQFSYYFKRLVGVTPGQFQTPARIA